MVIHIPVETRKAHDWQEITQAVKQAVEESGVQSGFCILHLPHTTAALTISSFWDTSGLEDLQDDIGRLVPTRIDFRHQFDTPQDAAGHVKSSLMGVNMSLMIEDGKLLVGHSQGLFFLEFDGPRRREVLLKIFSDDREAK